MSSSPADATQPARSVGGLSEEELGSIRVLVVDDEATLRDTCQNVLRMKGFNVTAVGRGEEALDTIRQKSFDIFLLDLYMTQVPGMRLLEEALKKRRESIVVMMTGNPSVESNLEALEAGAWDYLPKPFSATHLDVLIGRAAHAVLDHRTSAEESKPASKGRSLPRQDGDGVVVMGESPAFRKALELAKKVARSNVSVFITGESGSGKELIAQYIHHQSRRQQKPMVAVNCAALPEPLLESEMFGHYEGAFTGAVRDKPGLFETANGGTMFLDELTEMSQRIQAKLLRVLQDGQVRRVGSNKVDAVVDVRFLAATNRDPGKAVESGDLRSDLYYRLRVVPIRVPPLRERQEDIALLAAHFLEEYWRRDQRDEEPPVFSDAAIRAMQAYRWPGNVRELQNMVEHAAVLAEPGAELQPEDIPFQAGDAPAPETDSGGSTTTISGLPLEEDYHTARDRVLAEFEKSYITALVARAGGNMSEAARIAGVDRTTLYRLIEKHDLERDTILRPK